VQLSTETQGWSDSALNKHISTPPEPVTEGGDEGRGGTDGSGEEYTTHSREDETEDPPQPEEHPR